MRNSLFLAAFLAVSTFSASVAVAKDVNAPAKGSACDIASKAFIKKAGGTGDRVRTIISEERDGGVSFLVDDESFPIGELNDFLPRLDNQAQAIAYGNANGAWAVLRKDGKMKVFYQSPNGAAWRLSATDR